MLFIRPFVTSITIRDVEGKANLSSVCHGRRGGKEMGEKTKTQDTLGVSWYPFISQIEQVF